MKEKFDKIFSADVYIKCLDKQIKGVRKNKMESEYTFLWFYEAQKRTLKLLTNFLRDKEGNLSRCLLLALCVSMTELRAVKNDIKFYAENKDVAKSKRRELVKKEEELTKIQTQLEKFEEERRRLEEQEAEINEKVREMQDIYVKIGQSTFQRTVFRFFVVLVSFSLHSTFERTLVLTTMAP